MEELENKEHEKITQDILNILNGLSLTEITKIIYRVEDLVKEKSKLII